MLLMVGAALLARTFWQLARLDPGFRPEHALTFRIAPPFQRYRPLDGLNAFHRTLGERLRGLSSVTAVGAISHLPYDELPNWATPYLPIGETDATKAGLADTRAVSPEFFHAIGATLVAGRMFAEEEGKPSPMPVIVDEQMAARLFGGANPVGQRFQSDLGGEGEMLPMTVIGVVRHLRHRSLTDPGREQLFVSSRLWPRNPASYVVRTTEEPAVLASSIRDAVRGLDPALPVYDLRPIDEYVAAARAPSRFTMIIALTFSGVALVLACVGVYGVVAYGVGRRAQEFGIRRALGAEPRAILRLVLTDAVRIGVSGLALGAAAALAFTRLLGSLLFGVTANDPIAYSAAIGTLGLSVLLASWLPARRAAKAAPMDILRVE